jgi:hypothetical protein
MTAAPLAASEMDQLDQLSAKAFDGLLVRKDPFVERNFNLVELVPRGTGKSHLFQQISPYSHLISGGKATVAKMFVNNGNGQRGCGPTGLRCSRPTCTTKSWPVLRQSEAASSTDS